MARTLKSSALSHYGSRLRRFSKGKYCNIQKINRKFSSKITALSKKCSIFIVEMELFVTFFLNYLVLSKKSPKFATKINLLL
jgi:hypothetical protein